MKAARTIQLYIVAGFFIVLSFLFNTWRVQSLGKHKLGWQSGFVGLIIAFIAIIIGCPDWRESRWNTPRIFLLTWPAWECEDGRYQNASPAGVPISLG